MIYFLICFSTIFIASRANLMYENITGVATIAEYRMLVIMFTIFSSCFFVYKTHKVFSYLSWQNKYIYSIINFTGFTMSLGSLCPYTINGHDLFSKLHVYCSMLSSLSFLILLFVWTRRLTFENPFIYGRIHWFYDFGIQMLGILIVVFTRVNGYIEILFAIFVCTYLYMIEKHFSKEKTAHCHSKKFFK